MPKNKRLEDFLYSIGYDIFGYYGKWKTAMELTSKQYSEWTPDAEALCFQYWQELGGE